MTDAKQLVQASVKIPDVDIDFPTSFRPEHAVSWTKASLVRNGFLTPHPCGVYPQNIAVDPITKLAAIPYKEAEELGYFKIDMLHLHYLDFVSSRTELQELLKLEPDWGLLLLDSTHPKLFQLSKHGTILRSLQPKSVEELAEVLALIRPGKKQYIKLYKTNREAVRKVLWTKDDTGYSFKRSHAIAYALNIVAQLHLIAAGIF